MTLLSRKYIDDHDFIERYLADKLSEDERESFEAYYLEHPEVLPELNNAAKFKSGLIDLQELKTLEKLLTSKHWWQRASTLAVAASFVVIVIGGLIWFNLPRESRPILASSVTALTNRFQSKLPIAGTYDLQRTRSSSYDATIKLLAKPAAIELRIKPDVTAVPARYRVDVGIAGANSYARSLATISDLRPATDGFVPIYLSASALSPGIYELTISGDTNTTGASNTSSFLIEVLGADGR